MKKEIILTSIAIIMAISTIAQETGNFKDLRDAKTYKTIKIGEQTWMSENLAYKAESGCWSYYDNESNVEMYGYLYDWETAKKVCPAGWHLPSDAEWTKLGKFLGGDSIAGGKLKLSKNWTKPNKGATNSSGFSAIPGGYRSSYGVYYYVGTGGYWWSSTDSNAADAWVRFLMYDKNSIDRDYAYKTLSFSIRCIKD